MRSLEVKLNKNFGLSCSFTKLLMAPIEQLTCQTAMLFYQFNLSVIKPLTVVFAMFSSNRPLKFWSCFRKVNKHQLATCVGRRLRALQTTVKCSCILQTDSYQLLHANKATCTKRSSFSLQLFLTYCKNSFWQKRKEFLAKSQNVSENFWLWQKFLRKICWESNCLCSCH